MFGVTGGTSPELGGVQCTPLSPSFRRHCQSRLRSCNSPEMSRTSSWARHVPGNWYCGLRSYYPAALQRPAGVEREESGSFDVVSDTHCEHVVRLLQLKMPVATHEINIQGTSGAIFWFILSALIFYVLGFATVGWEKAYRTWTGLWFYCSASDHAYNNEGTCSSQASWLSSTLYVYRVGQRKRGHRLMIIILSNLNRFTKKFTGRFLGKFAVKRILKIAPHLAYVATLPCETLLSAKQAITL